MDEREFDDREFGEEYKRMFDGIRASDELRRRIAELPNKARRRRTHDLRPYIAAAGAAAAGLTIFAAVHNYDPGAGDDGVISETVATSTERPGRGDRSAALPPISTPEISGEAQATAAPAASAAETQAAAPQQQSSGGSDTSKTTEDYMREALEKYGGSSAESGAVKPGTEQGDDIRGGNDAGSNTVPDESSGGSVYFEAESGASETEPAQEDAAVSSAAAVPFGASSAADMQNGGSAKVNDEETADAPALRSVSGNGVVLNMNPPSVYAAYEAQYYGADAGVAVNAEYGYETWDNERYFEYIGSDLIEKTVFPEDFAYTGDTEAGFMVDENGVPMHDSRIFVFEGGSGRFVSIMTSKDTVYADTYLTDDALAKSDICGTDAVVFDMSGAYKCYMVYGGVSYIIDAEGTDEEELAALLASLTS